MNVRVWKSREGLLLKEKAGIIQVVPKEIKRVLGKNKLEWNKR
jgi:hypothetical protein